jgi:ribosomal protein L24
LLEISKERLEKFYKFSEKKNKVKVENIGFYKKHIKSRVHRKYPEGGIIEKLKFIDVSNVMFFSKDINRPGRIGYTVDKKGSKTRELRGRGFLSKE